MASVHFPRDALRSEIFKKRCILKDISKAGVGFVCSAKISHC